MLDLKYQKQERLVQLLFLIQNGEMLRKGSIEPDLDFILLDGLEKTKSRLIDFSTLSEYIVGIEERRLLYGKSSQNMLKKISWTWTDSLKMSELF